MALLHWVRRGRIERRVPYAQPIRSQNGKGTRELARLAYATPVQEAAAAEEKNQHKDDENGCHACRTAGHVP
jgi:hypothetical protein